MIQHIVVLVLLLFQNQPIKERTIVYNGEEYKTTFGVEARFLGIYKGKKTGYLQLKPDGTGVYKYDLFGMAPATCKRTPITFEWGFLLTEKGGIMKRKRDYGYSYPVLLKCTSETSFQGCHTPVMMEYILDRGSSLHVSSSDDWKKSNN